jgi:hypothetical protein
MQDEVIVSVSRRASRDGEIPRIVFERDGKESSSIADQINLPSAPELEKLRTAIAELRKLAD